MVYKIVTEKIKKYSDKWCDVINDLEKVITDTTSNPDNIPYTELKENDDDEISTSFIITNEFLLKKIKDVYIMNGVEVISIKESNDEVLNIINKGEFLNCMSDDYYNDFFIKSFLEIVITKDMILDKISKLGISNLTKVELEILKK